MKRYTLDELFIMAVSGVGIVLTVLLLIRLLISGPIA